MSNKNKTDNQPAVKKRWYSYKVKVRENGKLKQKYQGFDLAVNEEEIFLKWEAQGIPREAEFESLVDKASQPLEPERKPDAKEAETSESPTSGDCNENHTH